MKSFKTIDEQIQILKDRKLNIIDENKAKENLLLCGYYEIVNGYKTILLKNDDEFKQDETFEHLFSLYELDKNLKNIVLNSTLEFEQAFKTALGYTISENYGVENNKYLQRKNYKCRDYFYKNNSRIYHIDILLNKFNKIINDSTNPFRHYREQHGHIPPWILFKGASFGNMYYFFKEQKSNIKNKVVSIMLGYPTSVIQNNNDLKNLFLDGLNLIYKFRNRTAHGGRLYNYKPKNNIRYNNIFHNALAIDSQNYRLGYGVNDLYTLSRIFTLFKAKKLSINLNISIKFYLENHFKIYPNDKNIILTEMGVPTQFIKDNIEDIFYP